MKRWVVLTLLTLMFAIGVMVGNYGHRAVEAGLKAQLKLTERQNERLLNYSDGLLVCLWQAGGDAAVGNAHVFAATRPCDRRQFVWPFSVERPLSLSAIVNSDSLGVRTIHVQAVFPPPGVD